MAESNIKGTWKGINTSPSISKDPVVGMVYSSNSQVGILLEWNKQTSILLTKDQKQIQTSTQSLKIIIND